MGETSEFRAFGACGLVTREDGRKEIVLAGGGNDYGTNGTEVLNLETLTWRPGPELPHLLLGIASVQMENTFLAIGGADKSSSAQFESNSILAFDAINDQWVELPQKLDISASGWLDVAFLVPDEALDCS